MKQLPQPHSGQFDGPRHLFAVRVYYEDTDLSGIVYHANYLRWFERARSDMLRLWGIDQRSAQESGEGVYSVADLKIRYRAPARLDDDVLVESSALHLGAASVTLRQCAFRIEGGQASELLAEADVRIGFISPDGRPRRQPAAWRDALASHLPAQEPEMPNA